MVTPDMSRLSRLCEVEKSGGGDFNGTYQFPIVKLRTLGIAARRLVKSSSQVVSADVALRIKEWR